MTIRTIHAPSAPTSRLTKKRIEEVQAKAEANILIRESEVLIRRVEQTLKHLQTKAEVRVKVRSKDVADGRKRKRRQRAVLWAIFNSQSIGLAIARSGYTDYNPWR